MSGWYYTRRGQPRVGPIELDELQFKAAFGDVAAEDLVWHEGLPDWGGGGERAGAFAIVSGEGRGSR